MVKVMVRVRLYKCKKLIRKCSYAKSVLWKTPKMMEQHIPPIYLEKKSLKIPPSHNSCVFLLDILWDDPAIYTKMCSIFMTLSKFWAHFILCAHKNLRGVTVNTPLFLRLLISRGASLHIILHVATPHMRSPQRAEAEPGVSLPVHAHPCTSGRVVWMNGHSRGANCQTRSDCAMSLWVSCCLTKYSTQVTSLPRALPVPIIQILKRHPPSSTGKACLRKNIEAQMTASCWRLRWMLGNFDGAFLF